MSGTGVARVHESPTGVTWTFFRPWASNLIATNHVKLHALYTNHLRHGGQPTIEERLPTLQRQPLTFNLRDFEVLLSLVLLSLIVILWVAIWVAIWVSQSTAKNVKTCKNTQLSTIYHRLPPVPEQHRLNVSVLHRKPGSQAQFAQLEVHTAALSVQKRFDPLGTALRRASMNFHRSSAEDNNTQVEQSIEKCRANAPDLGFPSSCCLNVIHSARNLCFPQLVWKIH